MVYFSITGSCGVSRGVAIEEPFVKKKDLNETEPWVLHVGNQQFRFYSHNAQLILSEAVGKALAADFC